MLKKIVIVFLFSLISLYGNNFHIKKEYLADAPSYGTNSLRIKLKHHPKIKKGRVAIVDGELSNNDLSDSFFLGNTIGFMKLAITIDVKNQNDIDKIKAFLVEGKKKFPINITYNGKLNWFKVKGKIQLVVYAKNLNHPVKYYMMTWYPGNSINKIPDTYFENFKNKKPLKLKNLAKQKVIK